ncbi:hypothetical protein AB0903_13030 [Streptomyces sp. NPDC048389]|uniref:hypothetical protein n=1 Tax=Streptomyces sp. NPDC048389 TaxID=3154622 RepID=UPI00345675FE
MPAQARTSLPPPSALPGHLLFQPKWDGYGVLLFTPCPRPGPVLIQSRRGALIQGRFPDLVRAAAGLPDGLVLDGELIVWSGISCRSRRCSDVRPPAASRGRGRRQPPTDRTGRG